MIMRRGLDPGRTHAPKHSQTLQKYEHHGARQQTLWGHIADFTSWFLAAKPDGAVVRVSCTLKELEGVLASFAVPAIARLSGAVGRAMLGPREAARDRHQHRRIRGVLLA